MFYLDNTIKGVTSLNQWWKKKDWHQTDKDVNLVDESNYFINFQFFKAPSLGGALKAVYLPNLPSRFYYKDGFKCSKFA